MLTETHVATQMTTTTGMTLIPLPDLQSIVLNDAMRIISSDGRHCADSIQLHMPKQVDQGGQKLPLLGYRGKTSSNHEALRRAGCITSCLMRMGLAMTH